MVALVALGGAKEQENKRAKSLGVYCLESWSAKLNDRTTVRPLLEVLEQQVGLRFIHRFADSREQLLDYMARWAHQSTYSLGYLACHGDEGSVYYGGAEITLAELADDLERRGVSLEGKTIYFGSCSVLAGHGQTIQAFRRRVGADAVCGYRGAEGVWWLESAAFELLLFEYLASSGYATSPYALRDLVREYRQLAKRLEFDYFPKARARPRQPHPPPKG